MDGYGYPVGGVPGVVGGGVGGVSGGYPPPGGAPDYNQQPMQRPPSQTNTQSPHPGKTNSMYKTTLTIILTSSIISSYHTITSISMFFLSEFIKLNFCFVLFINNQQQNIHLCK